MSSSSSSLAPHRCFVIDALTTAAAPAAAVESRRMLRLMGTVVSMREFSCHDDDDNNNNISPSKDKFMLLELDDGTGTIICVTPMVTMERLSLRAGQMIECIGFLHQRILDQQQQPKPTLVLQVDTLLEVRGQSSVAERLRWMEITQAHHLKPSPSKHNNNGVVLCQGYPCPEITGDDILEIIESNEREGVTLSDLALVMDMEETHVKALIEDLQLQGLIYENEKGFFVPL